MSSLGQILYRTFFWSYERGSWQYDVAVVLIVLFSLATPRRWFHDQPEVGLPANASQVEQLSKTGEDEVYRVDARVLAPPAHATPALQNDLHSVLQKAQPDLNDGRFSIRDIEAIRDDKGNVVAYRVAIRH